MNPFAIPTMRLVRALLTVSATFACAGTAVAWDGTGHREVGAIADRMIAGTRAENEVREILGGWNLETVAVWADCVKGVRSEDDHVFSYAASAFKYPECAVFDTAVERERMKQYVADNWKQCGSAHGRELCHGQYHYTDVSAYRTNYEFGAVGTNSHDVVHAIGAAIDVLKDGPAPPPFALADRRTALMLLAHEVGDIHQPLHVAALYLDGEGHPVDPDHPGNSSFFDTAGGNELRIGGRNLHAEWDASPREVAPDAEDFSTLLRAASSVARTAGDSADWPTQWATDTLAVGRNEVFAGLSFHARATDGAPADATRHEWDVVGLNTAYQEREHTVKVAQLAKAGARLAQLLQAIWPDEGAAGGTACPPGRPKSTAGYLGAEMPGPIDRWLPDAPPLGSTADALDVETFVHTRQLLATPRGQEAAEDDVYAPADVLQRFRDAAAVELTAANAPTLTAMLGRMEGDGENLVAPVKRSICAGGRIRPFVRFPESPSCLFPVDMAGHRQLDVGRYHLDESGSYPSTHALVGMMTGMLLAELLPARSGEVFKRGLDFGESRVICGFHYESDVAAGRMAASLLFARLHAQPSFMKDLAAARREVGAAATAHARQAH
jgi:hypothetical protein